MEKISEKGTLYGKISDAIEYGEGEGEDDAWMSEFETQWYGTDWVIKK